MLKCAEFPSINKLHLEHAMKSHIERPNWTCNNLYRIGEGLIQLK